MKNLLLFILLSILAFNSYGAKISDDALKLGKPGSASDKTIRLGDTREIRSNETTGVLEFSNDGSIFKKLGSGSGSGSGGGGGINLLQNNSFEDPGTPVLNWTNTGGTFTQESYTNGREGNLSFVRFVATGAGEYFESDLITLSDDIGPGCMANIRYSQGDSAFDYKVLDGSNTELSTGSFGDLEQFDDAPIITFPCSGGTQYKLRIISTAAGTIDADDGYLGSNKNVADISGIEEQMQGFTYLGKASSNTVRFSSGLTGIDDVANDIFTYTDDSTNGTQITVNKYADITVSVRMGQTSVQGFYIRLNGSNIISETTAQSSVADAGATSLRVLAKPSDVITIYAATATYNQGSMVVTAKTREVKQSTYTPEQADFFISANIGGANSSLFTTSTPLPVIHTGIDMVLNSGSAKIACDGIASTGLTCSGASEAVGISFNAPVSGKYKVCASFGKSDSGTVVFRLAETELATNTILQEGNQASIQVATPGSNRLCSYFEFGSTGERVVKLFYEGTAGGASTVLMDRSAVEFGRDANLTVELVSHNTSRPILQKMVDTTKARETIKTCKFTWQNTTIIELDNTCGEWVNSFSHETTGRIQINVQAQSATKTKCWIQAGPNVENSTVNWSTKPIVSYIGAGSIEVKMHLTNTGGLSNPSALHYHDLICIEEK